MADNDTSHSCNVYCRLLGILQYPPIRDNVVLATCQTKAEQQRLMDWLKGLDTQQRFQFGQLMEDKPVNEDDGIIQLSWSEPRQLRLTDPDYYNDQMRFTNVLRSAQNFPNVSWRYAAFLRDDAEWDAFCTDKYVLPKGGFLYIRPCPGDMFLSLNASG